jgi:hypothetical protein
LPPRRSNTPPRIAPFASRHFRTLFLAHLVSNLGDWRAFLALFSLAALEWRAGATRIALLAVA